MEIKDEKKLLNVESNGKEIGLNEYDKQWIEENKGYQLSDIKYPNFDDKIIDDQLKNEITYEILNGDINSIIELLIYFEKSFIELFSQNKKKEIVDIFTKYSLNYPNFILYSSLSRRKITLMSFLIKLKFEGNDVEILKTIEEEYKTIEIQKITKEFYVLIELLKLSEEHLHLADINELIEKDLINEKIILLAENIPSICGICVCIKFLKSIIEKAILDIQKLIFEFKEETAIDFIHLVYIFIYKIVKQIRNCSFYDTFFV